MRTLFTRIAISAEENGEDSDDMMDRIIDCCLSWVQSIYPSIDKDKIGNQKLKNNASVSIEYKYAKDVRFWKMIRSEPGTEERGTQFINYIFIAKNKEWVEFSLLQSVIHPINRIIPHEIPIYPPKIINKIIDSFNCRLGQEVISSNWTTIVPGNIAYLSKKIINPERRMPVIVLSKKWDTRKSIIQKPGILSNKLAGLADIYILSDPNTKQLGNVFGRQWITNGTLRIFWPGITTEQLSYSTEWNNMYSQKKLDKEFNGNEGELIQEIINRVCLATMSQQASSDFVKNIREEIAQNELELEQNENNIERAKIIAEISSTSEKIGYLEEEIVNQNNKYSIISIKNNKINNKLEERNDTIESLKHQINALNDENRIFKGLIKTIEEAKKRKPDGTIDDFLSFIDGYGVEEEDGPEPEPEFSSIIDALEEAKKKFSRIKILETAFTSAKKTNSDADPAEIYQILGMLNDTIWPDIKKDIDIKSKKRIKIHDLMKDTFAKKYSPDESKTTRNTFEKEYNPKGRFFPLGENRYIRMYSHIRLGTLDNPLRIHLICLNDKSDCKIIETYINDKNKRVKKIIKMRDEFNNFPKIIIGWCGEHLPLK